MLHETSAAKARRAGTLTCIRTKSVDYGIVLLGAKIDMLLDDSWKFTSRPAISVIQQATNHSPGSTASECVLPG